VREYLDAKQLAAQTPWSVNAIEKMIRRGVLRKSVHWFQPFGRRTQVLFKWSAIVGLIEGRRDHVLIREGLEGQEEHGDVEAAAAELRGVLARRAAREAAPPVAVVGHEPVAGNGTGGYGGDPPSA
jgi:hypothetical protein